MKQIIPAGITSKMLTVFVQNSTSTVGGGLTGLVYNSAGLEWYWFAEDSTTSTAISLATMTLGTWATGGFVQVDATNLPGFYEIGIPNTLLAATNSRTWVTMHSKVPQIWYRSILRLNWVCRRMLHNGWERQLLLIQVYQ